MSEEMERRWQELKPEVDQAIAAGQSLQDFLAMRDINRDVWYRMKPAGFKWQMQRPKKKIVRKKKVSSIRPIEEAPPISSIPIPQEFTPPRYEVAVKASEENDNSVDPWVILCRSSMVERAMEKLA